ncbi:MAG: hypothetical protein QXF58_06015 [Desulfurococcaceae archaeon]
MKRIILLIAIAMIVLIAVEGNVPGVVYRGASPLNKYWDGTSIISEYLSELGSEVLLITDWRGLISKSFDKGVRDTCKVLFIVSPEKPYSRDELATIRSMVMDRGFNLVLMDEGVYGNDVLKVLEVPVVINSFNYIRDEDGSAIVSGSINVGNYRFNLRLAYASPLEISGNNTCWIKGVVGDVAVGSLCVLQTGSKVFILGDGSIVTNAALTPIVEYNPYLVFIEALFFEELCSGKNHLLVLMEAGKYRLGLVDLSEALANNITYREFLAMAINPSRYILQALIEINERYDYRIFIAPALVLTVALILRREKRIITDLGKEKYLYDTGYYLSSVILLLRNLCVNIGVCFEEFNCLVSKKINSKCRERVRKAIVENREIRRKVIRTLFHRIYGEKMSEIYEVVY